MSREAALAAPAGPVRKAQEDHWLIRGSLIALATAAVGILVVVPLANVFYNTLANGLGAYLKSLVGDPDTLHAIGLTLTVAPLAVIANVVFGVAAAWLIARFQFAGHPRFPALRR